VAVPSISEFVNSRSIIGVTTTIAPIKKSEIIEITEYFQTGFARFKIRIKYFIKKYYTIQNGKVNALYNTKNHLFKGGFKKPSRMTPAQRLVQFANSRD